MTVTVTPTRRKVQITVSYDVTGAEPMRADWPECAFVPVDVTLADYDGDVSYLITGTVLKKDGTPGPIAAHRRSWHLTDLATEPAWLQNLVRDYCAVVGIEVPS